LTVTYRKSMREVFIATILIALFSLLGAAAFNPDSGFLLHSEPLWRVFGLAAYVSWIAFPLIGLVAIVSLGVRWAAGCTRRGRSA
jgi:hypothetical protein